MFDKDQLEGIRVKTVYKIAKQIQAKESELSTKELINLLRLALKNTRSQD
jgi:hypothetical protein